MQGKKIKSLEIFVSSSDIVDHHLLYETIIRKAKEYGIAGGTVIKGALGYGLSTELRDTRYCELVEKFPIILNFIDEAEKIDGFAESILPWLQKQPKGCLVTTKDLNVLLAKKGDSKQ
ncbi:MAG: DUF190 domain-containing protein [Elusimicrobiaceae bacterium]|nr:DUF190 domain-containing protein [Elusimicrobiaceae bacterium]